MSELLNIAANIGFPMAVAAYLLIRIEGQLKELTAAIHSLREAVLTGIYPVPVSESHREESPSFYTPA